MSAIKTAICRIMGQFLVVVTCSKGLSWIDDTSNPLSFTNCLDTVAKHWHPESHRARVDVIEFIKISMYIPSVSRLSFNVLPFRFANLPTHFQLRLLWESTCFPTRCRNQMFQLLQSQLKQRLSSSPRSRLLYLRCFPSWSYRESLPWYLNNRLHDDHVSNN